MVDLALFGSYHINRLGVVTEDLESFSKDVDAFAVEYPAHEEGYLLNILKMPLFFLGTQLAFLLLQAPAIVLANRDLRSTGYVAAERVAGDRGVHSVDRSPMHILEDRGWFWTIANWLVFIPLIISAPFSTGVAVFLGLVSLGLIYLYFWLGWRKSAVLLTPVLSVVGWWALLTGYLASNVFLVLATAFIVMVAFTFSERNEAILDNIESIAEEHGYDEVCMVTGKAHVSALINEAQERGGDLEVSRAFYQQLFRHGEERQLDDIETRGGRRHVEPAMETAGNVLLRRATATMIDWVVLFALFFFLGVVFTVIRSYLGVGNETIIVPAGSASVTVGDLFWIFSIPLLLLYHPLMETRYGRSVGKYILGLVVVESDGGSLTPRSALIRWLFRPIDFLPSFYFFGALVSVLSDEGQRIGDHAAGTTVVMTRGRHDG